MSFKDITVHQLQTIGCHQLAVLIKYNDGLYQELIKFSGSKISSALAYEELKARERAMTSKLEETNIELIKKMSEQELLEEIFLLTAPVDMNVSKLDGIESDRDRFDWISMVAVALAHKLNIDTADLFGRIARHALTAIIKEMEEDKDAD